MHVSQALGIIINSDKPNQIETLADPYQLNPIKALNRWEQTIKAPK